MVRHTLVFLFSLLATTPALAGAWADGLFDDLSKDFGTVPKGTTLSHPFRIRNATTTHVHIALVRVSCGCVTVDEMAMKKDLAPGEETTLMAYMDTYQFTN